MFQKLLDFAMTLKAEDHVSPVLVKVSKQIEKLNETAKSTQHLREAAEHMAMFGAAAGGIGAAIGLPLAAAVKGYEELQDHVARLATAMGDVPDKAAQLAKAEAFTKEQAVATGFGMDQLTESLYQGLSGFLSMSQAMAVSTEAAKLARGTSGDLSDTTSALTTMMLNFGDSTKTPIQNAQMLADKMAALQTQFKFTNLTELTYAMKEAAPVAMGLGVSLDQTMGALATLSAGGLTGETGGEAFLEIMTQLSKASQKLGFEVFAGANGKGIDFLKTLEGIKAQFGDISQNKEVAAMFEKAFGARAGTRIAILLQHLDKYQDALKGVADSRGAVDRAFGEFQQRGTMAFSQLAQALDVLRDTIGGALAPGVLQVVGYLKDFAVWIGKVAEAHPRVTKFIALFAAISAGVLLAVGAIAGLVGGFLFLLSLLGPVAGIAAAVTGIGIAAAGAFAAFETWGSELPKIVGKVLLWIGDLPTRFFQAGVNMLGSLAKGMLSAASEPVKAIESVVSKVRSYLPFSPAKEGPLKDLHRVRIVQTIAETMKPGPMLSAVGRTAAAVAMAAPMMAAPVMAAPALAGGARGAGVAHYAPTINVTVNGPGDADTIRAAVRAALREHADEIHSQVERVRARKARTEWE